MTIKYCCSAIGSLRKADRAWYVSLIEQALQEIAMVTQQPVTPPMVSDRPEVIEVIYPESDGKPMTDNTKQFRWIVAIEQNLELLFGDRPDVFVAGDLLWYPVEGNNSLSTAPDAMVIFGRPKGDSPEATLCERGSYQQWREDNIPPQVVFEILSPSKTKREMDRKLLFYNNYGMEEYYLYDPDSNDLSSWSRSAEDGLLDRIESMLGWVSPHLGIRFEMGEELELYRPDGTRFFSFVELNEMLTQERQRAEQERQRADEMAALLQQYRDQFGELGIVQPS